MKKISTLIIVLFLATSIITQAQNVGIGATTFTPNASAGLDVDFTNKGLLIPRVALTASNAVSPVTGAATSLLVYNTATAGAAPNAVSPGYYYWNGSAWERFLSGSDAWTTKGNGGTAIATNFLGTTDNIAFAIRTNNLERMRITGGTAAAGGQVVINKTTAVSYDVLSAYANSTRDVAIAGYADSFSGGVGVYGVTNDLAGVIGEAADGAAIYGENNSIYFGAVNGYNGHVARGNGAVFAGNGLTSGVAAINGSGVSGVGTKLGVAGYTSTTSANSAGGFFQLGAGATYFSYVAVNVSGTNYKIYGTGSVSTIVRDLENKRVTMFCPEAPEILFQDFGKGELINGIAHIDLDAIFAKNIKVDAKHPLRVFVQLEGDCNGVYITNKTSNSFDVKELQNGNSTVAFTWFVTGNRVDEINAETGVLESKHEGVRFPAGIGPIESTTVDFSKIKVVGQELKNK